MRLFINFTVFSSTFVFNFCYIYNLYMIMPTQYKMDSYLLRDSLFVWWNSMYMNSFISSKNARKLVKITAKKTGICLYGEYNFSSWFSVSVRPNPPGIQSRGVFRISHRGGARFGGPPPELLCHSYLCTEQLICISALSKLRESAEISAVRYINLNGIVVSPPPKHE